MTAPGSLPKVKFLGPEKVGTKDVNITAVVLTEFDDSGILAVAPVHSFRFEGVAQPGDAPVVEEASSERVTKLLDEPAAWELAVPWNDSTCVVTKKALRARVDENAGSSSIEFRARPASSAEQLLVTGVAKILGPESSWDRVKGGLGLPVSQTALIASAAGLFGLAQYKDKIARPDLLTFAVIASALAVAASLWATNGLRTLVFRPARLDLMRPSYEHAVSAGTKASNRGLLLLIAAVLLALFSVWPTEDQEATLSSTVSWTATKPSGSATTTVRLDLRWSSLPSDVTTVKTIVRRDMTEVARGEAAPKADRTAEAEIDATTQPGNLVVETSFLGKDGQSVSPLKATTLEIP
jgi:hypothetical protein